MTSDPIQRAFDGCAHEATTTQVRHTGTLQACDDCGQMWSFPATGATESDETSSSGSGYRSDGDRRAEGRTAVRTFFDDDGEGEPTLWVDLGERGAWPVLRRCDLRPQVRHLWPLAPRADVERAHRLMADVRDGSGWTCQLDGVLVAQCDTYGKTEAERRAEAERDRARRLAADLAAENARLTEALARVRALADEWEQQLSGVRLKGRLLNEYLLAALDGSDS